MGWPSNIWRELCEGKLAYPASTDRVMKPGVACHNLVLREPHRILGRLEKNRFVHRPTVGLRGARVTIHSESSQADPACHL